MEGLGPSEVALRLTLKPSKRNIKQKNKKDKKGKARKTKKYKKWAFQLSVKIFFFGWVSKFSFFDNLAQKARTPQTL